MISKVDEYKSMIEKTKKGIELAKKMIEEHKEEMEKKEKSILFEKKPKPVSPSKNDKPILNRITKDYRTLMLVMRWVEFLFERVKRDKLTVVLDYYKDIGWISDSVKADVMAIARGSMQDVTKYEEIEANNVKAEVLYKDVEDWKLSAEDHLKSLLFIEKIAGSDIDKDDINSLEQQITSFKKSLESYYGV
jgi:flagellar protein FlaD